MTTAFQKLHASLQTMKTQERFWASVQMTDSCWIWTSHIMRNGYGYFCFAGKKRAAHRIAYEYSGRSIPTGLDLDHLCRNRACVNPDHLEPVTRGENLRRSDLTSTTRNLKKTHCLRGHDLKDAYIYTNKRGTKQRLCRACHRLRSTQRCNRCGREFKSIYKHKAICRGVLCQA